MFSPKIKWLINSIIIISLISTIGLVSCNKEEVVTLSGTIQISINNLAQLSDKLQMDAGFYKPSAVILTIKDASGKVVINNKKIDLTKDRTDYLTDSILLKEGNYSIDMLGVVSEDSTLMYLTPRSGSDFGDRVRTPLSLSFAIDGNKSALLIMDVLPVTLGSLEQFGMASSEFDLIGGGILSGTIQLSLNDLAQLSEELQMDAGFFEPSAVFITIKDASGKVVINNKKCDLTKVSTDYLTDPILLKKGFYSIDKLGVVSEDSTLMYLTPQSDSDFGYRVRTPLSHSFAIDANKSAQLIMDVLPVTLGSLEQFGMASSEFDVIGVMSLQPDSISGKDAFVHSQYPDINLGKRDMLESLAWIFTGPQIILRSYFDFETSTLPVGTKILKATLSLFEFHTSIVPSGGHYHYKGSNASTIQRVTSPWSEDLLTWNNQPTYISTNRVTLQQDTVYNQDYPNIDMTQLIQDLVNLPVNERYGFVLSLINETGYRAMIFGSSDTADETKRPRLVVTYKK